MTLRVDDSSCCCGESIERRRRQETQEGSFQKQGPGSINVSEKPSDSRISVSFHDGENIEIHKQLLFINRNIQLCAASEQHQGSDVTAARKEARLNSEQNW